MPVPTTRNNNSLQLIQPDAHRRGSHPMNEIHGLTAIKEVVVAPLRQSVPNLERRDYILIGDNYEGRDCLGLAGTGRKVEMRVMDSYPIDQGMIRENWEPIDIIHSPSIASRLSL